MHFSSNAHTRRKKKKGLIMFSGCVKEESKGGVRKEQCASRAGKEGVKFV